MRWWTPYAFLAPYLALFAVFMVLPIGFGFWTSLHEWDVNLPAKPFVGLENYTELFDSSSVDGGRFWLAMRATGIFTLFSVPLLIVLPLLVALLMNGRFRGRNLYRAVYFAPYVLGVAVVGFLWRFLLDGNIGLVNHYLGLDVQWTTDVPPAWIALVGVTVWWTLGLNAVIFLAGLQDIPRELHEAAMVDGASAWRRFRAVTLPGLRPVTVFVVNATILASANMFGQSYLITRRARRPDQDRDLPHRRDRPAPVRHGHRLGHELHPGRLPHGGQRPGVRRLPRPERALTPSPRPKAGAPRPKENR